MLIADGGRRQRKAEILPGEALAGVAQSLALIPGTVGRDDHDGPGLRPRARGRRFSFLLGVPAMFAAAAHEGHRMLGVPMDAVTKQVFLVGIVTSAVVGYAPVTYFLRYLVGHGLAVFAWYRIALAAVTLVWLFL